MKETKADRKREFGRKMDNTENIIWILREYIFSLCYYI